MQKFPDISSAAKTTPWHSAVSNGPTDAPSMTVGNARTQPVISKTPAKADNPATLFQGQFDDSTSQTNGRIGQATAGIMGGGLAAGMLLPTVLGVATGGGGQGQAAGGQAAQGGASAIGSQVMGNIGAIGSTVLKVGVPAVNAVLDAKSAYEDWGGKEKTYAYDNASGTVQRSVRGEDTARPNGFIKELAYDDAESAVHNGIKAVTNAAKGTSKIMDSFGVPVGSAVDALGLNPVGSAGQMANGSHMMVKNGIEVVRHQLGKDAARDGEHEAEERGDLLALGMHQAKQGHSHARNDAGRKVGLGALEATTGSLGIAQYADPTGATAVAHTVMSGATKAGKKGNKLYNAVSKGLRHDEVHEMRKAADAGDPEAKKWMLANDPRMASAQMLMHSQQGTDDSKAFAQEHVANTLRLGGDGKGELEHGRLREFDKVYAGRTGQKIESKLNPAEALLYGMVGPAAKRIDKFLGGGKKPKDSYGPENMPESGGPLSSNDAYFAREMANVSNALDKEKELKAKGASDDEQAAAFNGVDRGAKPVRALPEVREYNKVKDFRLDKTHGEMIEKAEQTSLKKHFKAEKESTGELYNPDSFTSAEEMVDTTHRKLAYKDTEGKINKQKDKAVKASKNKYIGTKELPEDIRAGVIAKEEERRAGTRQVGNNLPFLSPMPDDWRDKQAASSASQKETHKAAKEAGTLPAQVFKATRKQEKLDAKAAEKAVKAAKKSGKTGDPAAKTDGA